MYKFATALALLIATNLYGDHLHRCPRSFSLNAPDSPTELDQRYIWVFNSSNLRKRTLLSRYKKQYKFRWSAHDLREIDADHISIVAHKASRFRYRHRRVIVEDTALHVEGEDIGTDIKWRVHELPRYVGRKATWVSLLAYRDGNTIKVFRAEIKGTITQKRSDVGGIEDYFQPDKIQHHITPSTLAMEKLVADDIHMRVDPIEEWHGEWQD